MKTSSLALAIFSAVKSGTLAAPISARGTDLSVIGVINVGGIDLKIYVEPVDKSVPEVFYFSSTFAVNATPDQVVNGTTRTGGLSGASGIYNLGINSKADTICYNITLYGFRGEYQSPAATATHLHEAALGASGPPRIAFPNPQPMAGNNDVRNSIGCMTGPFKTGLLANGIDTGDGFKVADIEKNPAGFFADVHSSLAVPGAVRGQLA